MTASLFGFGNEISVSGGLVPQSFVATAAQTLFTLNAFQYAVGTNSLLVFINGVLQKSGRDFTETSNSSFTLLQAAAVGDLVDVIGFPGLSLISASIGQQYNVIGISGTAVPANNLRGTAVFAASANKVVVFTAAEPDALYTITHSGNAAGYCWITNKLSTGFTLNCSAANSNSTDWHLIR